MQYAQPKYQGDPTIASLANGLGTLGRYGDSYMVHAAEGETVIPAEVLAANPELKNQLFWQMRMMGIKDPNRYVVGNTLNSINPVTGQPEFWFKKIWKSVKNIFKKALPVIAPILGNLIAPGIGGIIASGLVTKLQGGSWGDVLKSAALSYGIGALGQGVSGAFGAGSLADAPGAFTKSFGAGLSAPWTAAKGLLSGGATNPLAQGILGSQGAGLLFGTTPVSTTGAFGGVGSKALPGGYKPGLFPTYDPLAGGPPTLAIGQTGAGFGSTLQQAGVQGGGIPGSRFVPGATVAGPMQAKQLGHVGAHVAPPSSAWIARDPTFKPNVEQIYSGQTGAPGTRYNQPVVTGDAGAAPTQKWASIEEARGALGENQSLIQNADGTFSMDPQNITTGVNQPGTLFGSEIAARVGERLITPALMAGLAYITAEKPEEDPDETRGKLAGEIQRNKYDEWLALPPEEQYTETGVSLLRQAGIRPSGQSVETLARSTGVSVEEAQAYLDRYYGPQTSTPSPETEVASLAIEPPTIPDIAIGSQDFNTGLPPELQPGVIAAKGGIVSLQGGGEITGPGSGTSDSIPARLSDGEFVMTANAVRGIGNGNRDLGAARMYDLMSRYERTA
jgi:hypothetical protein